MSAEGRPEQRMLGEAPSIHPTAEVIDCSLGVWTEVGEDTRLRETSLGDYSYITRRCSAVWTTIGKFCSIADDTRINPGNHPTWRVCQHHSVYRAAAYGLGEDEAEFFAWRKSHWVDIGHDAWIGHGAVILPGVRIGVGAVVGAGAVVTRDVEPYQMVGGTPAKLLKRRFTPEQADALMQIAWWDWPRERFAAALQDIRALSVDAFIEKHRG